MNVAVEGGFRFLVLNLEILRIPRLNKDDSSSCVHRLFDLQRGGIIRSSALINLLVLSHAFLSPLFFILFKQYLSCSPQTTEHK